MNQLILIVEDDPGSREALTTILRNEGYQVTAQGDGAEALTYLRGAEKLPKLIVLDLMMPGMEGWEFRHEQRRDPKLAGIPVIAVSAAGKLVDVEFSFRKPLDFDKFLHAVQQYVGPPAPKTKKPAPGGTRRP
jgi:CheY-like chemotaxis protein